MSKNLQDQILELELEIERHREQVETQHKLIRHKCSLRDKLLIEFNKDNLNNVEWLFKNPTSPGVHEKINELIENQYGGEYNGPRPSGYIQDDDYKPVQKNFDLNLRYGDRDQLKKNCDHFVENYLQFLDPVVEIYSRWDESIPETMVIPLQFRAEEYGLDYLGYAPDTGEWYHYTVTYGRVNARRKFKDWDEAFEFAYSLATKEDDDY